MFNFLEATTLPTTTMSAHGTTTHPRGMPPIGANPPRRPAGPLPELTKRIIDLTGRMEDVEGTLTNMGVRIDEIDFIDLTKEVEENTAGVADLQGRVAALEAQQAARSQAPPPAAPAAAPAPPRPRAPASPIKSASTHVIRETENGPFIKLEDLPLSKLGDYYYAFFGRIPARKGCMTAERARRGTLGSANGFERVPHIQGTRRTLCWASFVSYYNKRRAAAHRPAKPTGFEA